MDDCSIISAKFEVHPETSHKSSFMMELHRRSPNKPTMIPLQNESWGRWEGGRGV